MQKLLTCLGLLISPLLLAGCAMTTAGLGDEGGGTALPSGLTLLESDEEECEGTIQIGEDSVAGEGLGAEFLVERGQNAAFELEDDDLEWACVGGSSDDVERMDCPAGSTHVRITRAAAGAELLFECYG